MAQAKANAFVVTESVEAADVLVINTCGFIEAAKQESIDHILEGVTLRKKGQIKKLLVMGCLSQRYGEDLKKEIPEVDRYFGSNHLPEILKEMGGDYKYELLGERQLSTPQHFAYLKISEGCDNPCSFCSIPIMRGGHRSKPMEALLLEAQKLRAQGVKELVLIGQDLTYYGLDLYGRRCLSEVLKKVSDIGFEWIRLLYAYPAKFPTDILPVIRERENICNYLDMPIQHVNTEVLKSMRRGVTENRLRELIQQIREEVPNIRLRTTLIIGYPAETKTYFDELLYFVSDLKFDRLGVFPYSLEDGTTAFELGDPISKKEKQRRISEVMTLQESISYDKNQHLVGSTMQVLIDRIEDGVAFGRTEYDAPEVDNEVIIQGASDTFEVSSLAVGQFYPVNITDAEAFDLFGSIVTP